MLTIEGHPVQIATSTPVFSGDVPYPLSMSAIQKWHMEKCEHNREMQHHHIAQKIPVTTLGQGWRQTPVNANFLVWDWG